MNKGGKKGIPGSWKWRKSRECGRSRTNAKQISKGGQVNEEGKMGIQKDRRERDREERGGRERVHGRINLPESLKLRKTKEKKK